MKAMYYAAVSAVALVAAPAYAQSEEGATGAESTAPTQPDVIVVTARLRDETLQDTPAAVSVATAEMIEKASVTSSLDLPRVVPGLVIERAPAALNASVTLRGLGSSGAPGTFESSVGFFVNGIYLPRSREFSTALFDVERIEVVRGSQGSVLGKNVSLGAVNLVTKKPRGEFEGDIRASHEFNFDSWTVTGGLSVPLSDTLSLRVAGIYERQGAWVENVVTGEGGGKQTRKAGRATLVWSPTPDIDATLVYEHLETDLVGLTAEIAQSNAAVIGLSALAGVPNVNDVLDYRSVDSDSRVPGGYIDTDNTDRGSLTVQWDFGAYGLMSQTAYSDSEGISDGGLDYLPGDYFRYTVDLATTSFSQELRLTSPSHQAFRQVIGAWYGENTYKQADQWDLTYPPPLGATNFINNVDQKTTSWSVFGQADYDILDDLTLSGGIRYTDEKKEADFSRQVIVPGVFTTAFPPFAPFTLSRRESVVDGLVSLRYKPTKNLMFYAAWAKGTKSGGFASVVGALDQSEYDPETSRTYELGARFESLNRSFTANATFFSTQVDGYQLSTFNGTTFVVANTDLKSQGIESQLIWRPTFASGLRLDWTNTYAKAEDTITGGRVPNNPRWSGGASTSYEHFIGGGITLSLSGGVQYESSQTRQQNPNFPPPSDGIEKFDASIGLESDAGYAVRLVGRNLTDAQRTVFAFPTAFVGPGSYTAVLEHPRTISLELSYRF